MENARLPKNEESSAVERSKSNRTTEFTARQCRVCEALLVSDFWIGREEIDRIAGASNGPQIIAELRHGWGIDIEMRRVDRVDRDGRHCKPGQYRITTQGRGRLAELKGEHHG